MRPRDLADLEVPSRAAAAAGPAAENLRGAGSSAFFLLPNREPKNPSFSFLPSFFGLESLSFLDEKNPPRFFFSSSFAFFKLSVDC